MSAASARGLFRATGKTARTERPRTARDFYPTPPPPMLNGWFIWDRRLTRQDRAAHDGPRRSRPGADVRVMKVLVACEFSGVVRRAFAARGHDAWSCDLLPAEDRSNRHIIGDVCNILNDGWDMLIVAHPPCTRLCNSGVRWPSNGETGQPKGWQHNGLR